MTNDRRTTQLQPKIHIPAHILPGIIRAGEVKVLTKLLIVSARINFTCFDANFVSIVNHARTNQWKPAPSKQIICLTDMTDGGMRQNTKATTMSLKSRISNGAGFSFICICGSKTRLKTQIETRVIDRGIAVMPAVLIITCVMCRNRVWVTSLYGWRTGLCNRYLSSLGSSGMFTTFFILIRNNVIFTVIDILGKKPCQKYWILSFIGNLHEIVSDS